MKIKGTRVDTSKITEAYRVGSHAMEIVTDNHRHIRITAHENLGATAPTFDAEYEERFEKEIDGEEFVLWNRADFPAHQDTSIEKCLEGGLQWIRQRLEGN